jgi:mannose-6-phosphate isomerase-like protein (cupin superfamily)
MPKVSKQSVTPSTEGPGTEWRGELDGYTASLVKVDADADLTELLKGLPEDQCPSPHWGYVLTGRMWFRNGDREEAFGPGDAFYVQPGHTSGADSGSEFVVFSPTEVMADVEAHMTRRARQLHSV